MKKKRKVNKNRRKPPEWNNADKLNRYLRISLRFENALCVCYLYRCAHKQAYVKYSDCTGGFNVQFIWNQVNETMGKEN